MTLSKLIREIAEALEEEADNIARQNGYVRERTTEERHYFAGLAQGQRNAAIFIQAKIRETEDD